MTDTAPAEPDGAPRIAALDVMRGIAILGILFMNIPLMGGTIAGAHGPLPSLLGWTPLDRAAWTLQQLFANGTARCLLEMLFGAGMVILTARVDAARYYWRQLVLFAFGIAHVWLLLWPGDILHIYALSAMLAYPLRRLPAKALIALALLFSVYTAVTSAINLHNAVRGNAVVAAARVHRAQGLALTDGERREIEGLDGWHQMQAKYRADNARELIERGSGLTGWRQAMTGEWIRNYGRWRTVVSMYGEALATVLLGAALFKLGILQGQRTRHQYRRMMLGWYAVGLSIRLIENIFNARQDDTVTYLWALNEVGRLATTLGHIGLVNLVLGSRRAGLLKPFAAAGRTALTLYILQTLLCLWVIYPPWGLALFGRQGWVGLMATGLIVDAGLLMLAVWWVRRFPIAPVEWAWRSLASGRRLPFAPAAPIGVALG